MDIKTIHDSLVNGQLEQAARQIAEYEGGSDNWFFNDYQEWLLDAPGIDPLRHYAIATRAYLRLRGTTLGRLVQDAATALKEAHAERDALKVELRETKATVERLADNLAARHLGALDDIKQARAAIAALNATAEPNGHGRRFIEETYGNTEELRDTLRDTLEALQTHQGAYRRCMPSEERSALTERCKPVVERAIRALGKEALNA